ncbi:MAG: carboxymuconolactone decarboxylase family protein [Thermodesulfovibrionales bacterium]|nr:carboxymuconolactone decarboxylase family protein [Thermodesulfovibrionales bacterium]
MAKVPEQHTKIKKQFSKYFSALENLGKAVKSSGPLDEKTCQLIQLAASAAIRSEGAVHSHTRRALEAGATNEEIYQAILLTTSTIGFPTASAALSWADDIIKKTKE